MSKKQLEETVKDTPTNLDIVYEHNWKMITKLKDTDKNRAFALLRWAVFAVRPVEVHKVVEAILIEETHECDVDDLFDDINKAYVDTEIVGLYGSLLEVKNDLDPSSPGR
ncbi:hypothetical protein B0T11DRAFT_134642 [Plectosphaerella cucumerina]|uniref:Uncharacterized protein n=1 Tax=Plectosphaerella cucumerina TaxID=40658 RepID=A0A8K0T890_9PEZI|nr:hypothetical protein B0T11DRAFT_134642 [Plectosphaerella cucumerina]